jgi:hypothetical protein
MISSDTTYNGMNTLPLVLNPISNNCVNMFTPFINYSANKINNGARVNNPHGYFLTKNNKYPGR